MKVFFIPALIVAVALSAAAQTDLSKIVETEQAFAALAAEKGTRTAFLANMADEALVFNPAPAKAKPLWTARGESKSLLSWAPNFADIAADGKFGYTTGNWEYRANGKGDAPSAFGEFITLWTRQPDSGYKFVIDIGVSHPKPAEYSTRSETSKMKADQNARNVRPDPTAEKFAERASTRGAAAAYGKYASDEIRLYREDKSPFLGRRAALAQAANERGTLKFGPSIQHASSANLAYELRPCKLTRPDGTTESGNSFQIWKFTDGKWLIVLDILKPVPAK